MICRSLRGNVDRNDEDDEIAEVIEGRSLRGNVDRNATQRLYEKDARGRSLRGNVDRNVLDVDSDGVRQLSFPTWERG
mgnify:CR=1 FL=1